MYGCIGSIGIVLSLAIGLVCCQAQSPRPAPEAAPAPPQAPAIRETLLAKGVLSLLHQYHLHDQPVNDDTAVAAFDLFLSTLDPRKLYLTQLNVEALRRQAKTIDDQLRAGQFKLAHEAGVLRRKRAALVARWIQSLLTQPFDFTRTESVELSLNKRAFAQDDETQRDRWRRLLKHEALILIRREQKSAAISADKRHSKGESSGTPVTATDTASSDARAPTETPATATTDAEREAKARATLIKRHTARFERIAKENRDDDIERFINAFVRVYDRHSGYLPPFRKANFDIDISGSLEGIGAALRHEEGSIRVQRIVPGSASWRQGQLKVEDVIIAVAQDGEEAVDVVEARLRDVVKLVRGKKGTVVQLTVRKPDGKVVVIPITRDVVWLEAAYAKAALVEIEGLDGRFAYIDVPKFYGNIRGRRDVATPRHVSSDIRLALLKLNAQDVRGLVLDVRGNSGGLLNEAANLTGLFIKRGPVVQMRNAGGQLQVLGDEEATVVFNGPVVVLIDRFSASASEIIAAALQDYGRAVVVGSITYGKGTVQQFHSLDRVISSWPTSPPLATPLGSLKITRYQFYGIDGKSIQLRGVTPDIELPDAASHLKAGEGATGHAIPWGAVKPLSYSRWPEGWDVPHLRNLSLKRQASNSAFDKLLKRTKRLKQLREDTLEPLEQTAWRHRREQEETELEGLKLDQKSRFAVHPIVYITDPNAPRDALDGLVKEWIEQVEDDPWIEEAIRIVNDMSTP